MKSVIVVGAGPVGLAAALSCVEQGHAVKVLEKEAVGASLRRWGPTLFFSPLAMNVSASMRAILGKALPADDALLTGAELCDKVLVPLANSQALDGHVLLGHGVTAVGRSGMTRGDFPAHPVRWEKRFQVVADTPRGERIFEADAVLDASGTYGRPAAFGPGGLPALGDRHAQESTIRSLGALDERRDTLANKRLLLVGHGHSAANAIAVLAELALTAPKTQVTWCTRSPNLRPCVEASSDPLPERHRVVSRANELAVRPPAWLRLERGASIERLHVQDDGSLRVTLSGERVLDIDYIVALTGYRPDLSFLSELALDIAPASEGAGPLMRALANVTDCLAVPQVAPKDLASGEPGFHLVGSKSYGRSRAFLLKTGYAQLATIVAGLFTR